MGSLRPSTTLRSAQGEVKWLMALRKAPHPERSRGTHGEVPALLAQLPSSCRLLTHILVGEDAVIRGELLVRRHEAGLDVELVGRGQALGVEHRLQRRRFEGL